MCVLLWCENIIIIVPSPPPPLMMIQSIGSPLPDLTLGTCARTATTALAHASYRKEEGFDATLPGVCDCCRVVFLVFLRSHYVYCLLMRLTLFVHVRITAHAHLFEGRWAIPRYLHVYYHTRLVHTAAGHFGVTRPGVLALPFFCILRVLLTLNDVGHFLALNAVCPTLHFLAVAAYLLDGCILVSTFIYSIPTATIYSVQSHIEYPYYRYYCLLLLHYLYHHHYLPLPLLLSVFILLHYLQYYSTTTVLHSRRRRMKEEFYTYHHYYLPETPRYRTNTTTCVSLPSPYLLLTSFFLACGFAFSTDLPLFVVVYVPPHFGLSRSRVGVIYYRTFACHHAILRHSRYVVLRSRSALWCIPLPPPPCHSHHAWRYVTFFVYFAFITLRRALFSTICQCCCCAFV